MDRGIK
ncbi:99f64a4a-0796-4f79-b358-7e82e26a3252 [Thermothielavioides terrestris]|nr:99f64a4a-0796-4f79-b358-7e82e26a3252 [Thermothielavioides terrestris]